MSKTTTLGNRLELSRRAKKFTQVELADILQASQGLVSQWEASNKEPTEKTLLELSRILDVPIGWLTDGSEPSPDFILHEFKHTTGWGFRPQPLDGARQYGNANVWAIPWKLENLVREAGQNSLDARLTEDRPVRMEFRIYLLEGESLQRFLDAVRWESETDSNGLSKHIMASVHSGRRLALSLSRGLERLKSGRLILLRVDDYNTVGLSGDERGSGKFPALTRNDLDTEKQSAVAGGSYGLGKAVFWRASLLSTVLFNAIPAEERRDMHITRIFGRTELPWHEFDGNEYAGPGWFGEPVIDREMAVDATSIRSAVDLAKQLYLDREAGASGTSILVMAFHDPSSEEDLEIQEISAAIQKAVAKNFWPALAMGKFKVSVSTYHGHRKLAEIPVEAERLEREYVDTLRKYENGELSETLNQEGDVVLSRAAVLRVPGRNVQPGEHPPVEHEAILLVRRDVENPDEQADEVVFFRSQGMIVKRTEYRGLATGSHPFRCVVMAGEAAGDLPADNAAEAFLRLAEPPAHDDWVPTPDLRNSYELGWKKALDEFFGAIRETIRGLIRPSYEDLDEGPRLLGELLRIIDPDSIRRPPRPTLEVDRRGSRIEEDGSWTIVGIIQLPTDKKWRITPLLTFAVESGRGVNVDWKLEPLEGCTSENGKLIIPKGVRLAKFRGRSIPSSHPAPSTATAIDVALSEVYSE